MRDSELIRQRAEELFEELKRYFPEEDSDFIIQKIEIAMLRAHVDANVNVHDEEEEENE